MVSHALSPLIVSNAEGTKANLFVTIPAVDSTSAGGVMLSGHTDVVPVDGQVWTSDPFSSEIRDGKIYGRGACDMKAFGGVILAMLPDYLSVPLHTPLHLAFTYDEEVGCHGAGVLLRQLEVQNIHPALCIVGEPTSMRRRLFRLSAPLPMSTGPSARSIRPSKCRSQPRTLEWSAAVLPSIRWPICANSNSSSVPSRGRTSGDDRSNRELSSRGIAHGDAAGKRWC